LCLQRAPSRYCTDRTRTSYRCSVPVGVRATAKGSASQAPLQLTSAGCEKLTIRAVPSRPISWSLASRIGPIRRTTRPAARVVPTSVASRQWMSSCGKDTCSGESVGRGVGAASADAPHVRRLSRIKPPRRTAPAQLMSIPPVYPEGRLRIPSDIRHDDVSMSLAGSTSMANGGESVSRPAGGRHPIAGPPMDLPR